MASLKKVLDSGKPPQVVIVLPARGAQSLEEVITAEARITDGGGGIGRAEWRVNGLTVGVVPPSTGADKVVTVKQSVALDPGENTIEIVAYNGKNLLASPAVRTTVTSTATERSTKPKLHVIAVGINDYRGTGLRSLTFAVPDAKAVAAALKAAGKDQYESVEVTCVLDTDAKAGACESRFDPTAKGLEQAFEAMEKKVHPRDTFVFFAAAHGKAVKGRFHLMTTGARYENDQAIAERAVGREKLQALIVNKIKAKRGLILLDTCESGALVAGGRRDESEAALSRLHEATGRPVITASKADQSAFEGQGHGVFTRALLDALVKGDSDNDGLIEVREIEDYVHSVAPKLGRMLLRSSSGPEQRAAITKSANQSVSAVRPVQKPSIGSLGEDFPLVKRLSSLPVQ